MRKLAKDILAEEAQKHGMTVAQFVEPYGGHALAHARQDAMMRIFIECPHYSLPRIGTLMQKDHTTVLHGVKSAAKRQGMTYEQVRNMRLRGSEGQGPQFNGHSFGALMSAYAEAMNERRAA